MPTPGLDKRLDQHARRSGLAVGLTMAATIALCVLGFSLIYTSMEPLVRDFVDESVAAGARVPTKTPRSAVDAASAGRPTKTPTPKPTKTPRPAKTPETTPTSVAFQITHYSNPELRVNLRSQPGTDNAPVAVLDGGTPLQALGDEQIGPDGARWAKFRTQNGKEGWLREGTFVSA